MSQQQVQIVIAKTEKNPMMGAALSFFFGALGMLYSTPKGALIMFIPFLVSLALIPFIVGLPMVFICNVIACVWSYKACEAHNKDLVQNTNQVKTTVSEAA